MYICSYINSNNYDITMHNYIHSLCMVRLHAVHACMQDFEDSSVVLTKAQWAEQELAQVSYHMHASVY